MPRPSKGGAVEANFRELFRQYKRSARHRSLTFTLSIDRFRALTKQPCFICGLKPEKKYRHSLKRPQYSKPYVFNGIDRLRNSRGYIEGNVVTCCWKCNRAKSDLSLQAFMLYILKVYNHCIKPVLEKETPE